MGWFDSTRKPREGEEYCYYNIWGDMVHSIFRCGLQDIDNLAFGNYVPTEAELEAKEAEILGIFGLEEWKKHHD